MGWRDPSGEKLRPLAPLGPWRLPCPLLVALALAHTHGGVGAASVLSPGSSVFSTILPFFPSPKS